MYVTSPVKWFQVRLVIITCVDARLYFQYDSIHGGVKRRRYSLGMCLVSCDVIRSLETQRGLLAR
jgi:hypothetical protein